MAELKFQKELRACAESGGGWSETLSHRFKHGLPDLMWKLPIRPIVFVECKEVHISSKRNSPIVKIDTTELQRDYLKTLRGLGLTTGVLIKVVIDKKVHKVYTIKDTEAREFDLYDDELIWNVQERRTNEKKDWDVAEITDNLSQQED